MPRTLGTQRIKNKTFFRERAGQPAPLSRCANGCPDYIVGVRFMSPKIPDLSLEDELGDVLDKAICLADLTPESAAEKAHVELSRLLDALDWRSELTSVELSRLATVLGLNEVGLCALANGTYPITPEEGLPFCLHPLRMAHGIGVANAYIVAECGNEHGILFDTGSALSSLLSVWPASIRGLDAVFLTHVEPEHTGGLCEVVSHFKVESAFLPTEAMAPCGQAMPEGMHWSNSHLKVTALNTPGHCAAHNAYLVETSQTSCGRKLLISGDLIFAGSVGSAFYCRQRLLENVNRLLRSLPPETLIAPGHGPLTTVGNELRFNPFVR
jgi:glyoxylase-like metal-dependent hydrolase (beta-lactamase superfamily II)